MNMATVSNIVVVVLCTAVLIQSVRMMRSLRTVKDGALIEVVRLLDAATGEARAVLTELKVTLATEGAANGRQIEEARALRDELSMMIGIGDATAERIAHAASTANAQRLGERLDAEMAP